MPKEPKELDAAAVSRGRRIKEAYEARGLNRSEFQRELQRLSGPLQYHTVAGWEKGVMPDPERLAAIEEITGRSFRWIMRGEGETVLVTEEVPAVVEEVIAEDGIAEPYASRLRATRWRLVASDLGLSQIPKGIVRQAYTEMRLNGGALSGGQVAEQKARAGAKSLELPTRKR